MATYLEIINTIRSNASTFFQQRVPEATASNLEQVGNAITSLDTLSNEFCSLLLNKVAFTHVNSKMFKNPLARLKSGTEPFGAIGEEIHINPAQAEEYDGVQNKLLVTSTPDVASAFYSLARKNRYPATINQQLLSRAFQSGVRFMEFYVAIVNSMYSGDNIDEYLMTTGCIGKTIDANGIVTKDVHGMTTTDLCKTLSALAKYFLFPSADYSGYNKIHATEITAGTLKPRKTWCDKKNVTMIIPVDELVNINYDVLAGLFNIEKAELDAMIIAVDHIPCASGKVRAIIFDQSAIQIRDNLYKMKEFDNGATLEMNYWLHHWEYCYISSFGNAVALIDVPTE